MTTTLIIIKIWIIFIVYKQFSNILCIILFFSTSKMAIIFKLQIICTDTLPFIDLDVPT